jgi:hypothetical protein
LRVSNWKVEENFVHPVKSRLNNRAKLFEQHTFAKNNVKKTNFSNQKPSNQKPETFLV